jgi:DNA-binding transcriptional regulator YiaG
MMSISKNEWIELKKDAEDFKTGGYERFTRGTLAGKGPLIRSFRTKLGISQVELAKSLGVSVKRIQNWEQNTTPAPAWARKMIGLVQEDPKLLVRLQGL